MIILIIAASILALLLFLLLMPVSLRFSYRHEELRLQLCYLFLRFNLSPEALEKMTMRDSKKGIKKEYKAQEKASTAKGKKADSAKDTIKTVWALLRTSGSALGLIRRHLIFYRLHCCIAVARTDAHETALAYGRISALVSVLLSIFEELFVLRPGKVELFPDFVHQATRYDCSLRVRIQPIILLISAIKLGLAYADTLKKSKRPRAKNKRKGGNIHESATSH